MSAAGERAPEVVLLAESLAGDVVTAAMVDRLEVVRSVLSAWLVTEARLRVLIAIYHLDGDPAGVPVEVVDSFADHLRVLISAVSSVIDAAADLSGVPSVAAASGAGS